MREKKMVVLGRPRVLCVNRHDVVDNRNEGLNTMEDIEVELEVLVDDPKELFEMVGEEFDFELGVDIVTGCVKGVNCEDVFNDGIPESHVRAVMTIGHCTAVRNIEKEGKEPEKQDENHKKLKEIPRPEKKVVMVVCINNIGLEDKFDMGKKYQLVSVSDTMVTVIDEFEEKTEAFIERFAVTEEMLKCTKERKARKEVQGENLKVQYFNPNRISIDLQETLRKFGGPSMV